MKIKNYTDYSVKDLREIIKFVKPSGVSKFDISFKNCQYAYRGMAYTEGCSYHDSPAPLIIVSVGKRTDFPIRVEKRKGKGYLPVDIYSREEAFVYVTAHEIRHLWQYKHPKGWRVWGARGRYSERDADAYAIRKLRQWRRER